VAFSSTGSSDSPSSTPIVSSNSYEQAGAAAEHEGLTAYLRNSASTPTIQNAMDMAVAAMAIKPGDRVLDVGCGPGDFLPRLAQAVGPHGIVAALDHAPRFLVEARALISSLAIRTPVEYIEGDALALPFPDSSFDSAHTERVLMHLDDPDRALRELRRVVKPGGQVVCVEPDLVGMRMDHELPRLAQLLVEGFTETIRFPAMGLELNRRMASAGLIERSVAALTEVERDFPDEAAVIFRAGSDRLVAGERLDPTEAEAAITWLIAQSAAGRYTSYTSMFIVSGRVP
jgi:ubiquinone/menaquinone biosynthesis C-methylase UbiE